MGEFAYIGGAGGVKIGDNTIIGQYLSGYRDWETDEIGRAHV